MSSLANSENRAWFKSLAPATPLMVIEPFVALKEV
jgi:hypothetical protein